MDGHSTSLEILAESTDWIGTQENCADSVELSVRLREIEHQLHVTTARLWRDVTGSDIGDSDQELACMRRVWNCIQYHWKELARKHPMPFSSVLGALGNEEANESPGNSMVLRDVVLAQALAACEPRAAECFESEYMPMVRSVAYRTGGQRAVEIVENLAADLILERPDHPPRIAGYLGKTPFNAWLRIVTVNRCISHFRRQKEINTENLPDGVSRAETRSADHQACEDALQPVFRQVIGELDKEDRLLIKMLILDNVPQLRLAKSLGINSGNVTRRRQRIISRIWTGLKEAMSNAGTARVLDDCVELVLAGDDHALRDKLSELLASGFRGGPLAGNTEVEP